MGIIADFSEWQGTIDWAKVSALHQSGQLDGVILRVQAGYTHLDSRYKEYVAGCKQYGIPFGTYAYYLGINDADAVKEADSAYVNTDPASLCFGVDIEQTTGGNLVTGGQAFVDYLHSKGVKNVGIYSGKNFYDTHNLAAIKADWGWIAAYGVNDGQPHIDPKEIGEQLWQFTSVSHLDGVNTNVDESQEEGFNFFGGKVTQVATPVIQQDNPTKYPVRPVSTGNPIVAKVEVIVDALNCRQHPDPHSPVLFVATKGQQYNVTAYVNDWHEVIIDNDGYNGYLFGNNGTYLSLVRPQQPQAPVVTPVFHTVVTGDTVSGLAAHFGSTIAQIKAWNNLDANYTIVLGHSIRVK